MNWGNLKKIKKPEFQSPYPLIVIFPQIKNISIQMIRLPFSMSECYTMSMCSEIEKNLPEKCEMDGKMRKKIIKFM